ncbi:hypothetical protein C8A00DRAFT_30779 [Chaetomidium leptoderma]|uniref:Uncharacterized protein n=1 Tax=Chaetomidium leptoderma TaxID=669021 RepID=A0AAN6VS49_9PEZI|nr:hypothetical protein C8A00DRAFT_30779 [Chaetomidium leptoderma]
MEHPPSYQRATKRPDWLGLVAPYIPLRKYARLCLVSKRFYRHFAPRLWNDPFTTARMLNPDYDAECFLRFLGHAARFRIATHTNLVRSVDARCFFADTDALSQYTYSTLPFSNVLLSIAYGFCQSRCILLDGYPALEPLSDCQWLPSVEPPLLLSIPRCHAELPPSFFASNYLKSLVYLDVSDMPGSLKKPLTLQTLSPSHLPSLRILKVQGREMDNPTARLLFKAFREQLWSVDLSRNRLTHDIFDDMHDFSFPTRTSRTGDFAVEGRLLYHPEGHTSFGKFCSVSESEWSPSFSHPHRHLVDAPFYTPQVEDEPLPSVNPRLNGGFQSHSDSADAIKTMFSGSADSRCPSLESVQGLGICRGHHGITHLYLNGNNDISAAALARMIRSSPGQLQHLECDSVSFKLPQSAPPSWLSKARLSGTLGSAHVFRPVFSANLQALRIHHSLVTQLLSVELDGLSPTANLWVAETHLLSRAELAYPEAFVPDMNPRLRTLVLTQIPRYSTGPLIDKLVQFLRLASIQERAIQDIKSASRRGPATLLGLRHIRLEFQPDPREELGDDGSEDELAALDTAAVMDDTSKEDFSFFGESAWSSLPPTASKPSTTTTVTTSASAPHTVVVPEPKTTTTQSARLFHAPPSTETPPPEPEPEPGLESESEPDPDPEPPTSSKYLAHKWTWNATPLTLPIWAGTSTTTNQKKPTPAVAEYMRLLSSSGALLQADPVPASPCHVAAGVPPGEYVFSAAWEAILVPPPPPSSSPRPGGVGGVGGGLLQKPTRAELRGSMRDVVGAIKGYRAATRKAYEEVKRRAARLGGEEEVKWGEPHFHWGGRLEVSVDSGAHYHQSKYWR